MNCLILWVKRRGSFFVVFDAEFRIDQRVSRKSEVAFIVFAVLV